MFTRVLVWMIFAVVGLTAATHYLGRLSGGAPVLGKRLDRAPAEAPATALPSVAVVYRWRDANGTVHYESTPPPPGVEVEVLRMDRTASAPAAPARPAAPEPAVARPRQIPALPVGIPTTPDAIMRQLESTLEALDERNRTVKALEKQL